MIKALKSDIAILAVLLGALGAQIPHAKEVFLFLEYAPQAVTWHGYAYAFSLEAAVLIFVVNDCIPEAYFFAGVSILINLCYYALMGHNLWQWSAAPFWITSLALPIVIARYSHLIAKHGGQSAILHFDWRAMVQRARAWWRNLMSMDETPVQADAAPIETPGSETMQLSEEYAFDFKRDTTPCNVAFQYELPAQVMEAWNMKQNGMTVKEIAASMKRSERMISNYLKEAKEALQK